MKRFFNNTVATGFAIFSMFFGAGNVVFPLVIGRYAGDKNIYAVIGFLLTAVGVPFLGLVSMVLFDGDYKTFFARLGKIPASFVLFLLMAIIGPLVAIPRCVALSYTTMKNFMPGTSLFLFSLAACVTIFMFARKKCNIVDILGRILSPILLVFLAIIVVKGFISGPAAASIYGKRRLFLLEGLLEGYNTLDLLAAFFFSVVVLTGLKCRLAPADRGSQKVILSRTLLAGTLGISLLGLIYTGFSYVSAFYSEYLAAVEPDMLISSIAFHTLGAYAGIIACFAVSLACLTTAIALSVVFSDFMRTYILKNRISYQSTLLVSMVITFAMSNVGFSGIVRMAVPIITVFYPALIVLAIMNIAYKLWNVQSVKIPVYGTFAVVLLHRLLQMWR